MNGCNWCGFKAEYIQENIWPKVQAIDDILCGACLTILETPADELKDDQKTFLKIQLYLTDEQISTWPGNSSVVGTWDNVRYNSQGDMVWGEEE